MIIAMSGGMGVGKSTAIEVAQYIYPGKVKLVKFAQPLYDMQEMVYRRIQSVYKRPENFVKDGVLLQILGVEWGRNTISETLWIDLWKQQALHFVEKGFIVFCDDCRFDNEAEMVRSLGGTVIKITSDNASLRVKNYSGRANHTSEAGIASNLLHFNIENNGTPKEFQDKIIEIYKKILPPIKVQK